MRVLERKTPDSVKCVQLSTPPCAVSSRNGEKLGLDVNESVRKTMEGAPVQVVGVQIERGRFSRRPTSTPSEQRMLAQVQIETTRQQRTATINAEIQVVKAKAEADARRQQFTAEADGIRMRGGPAAAIAKAGPWPPTPTWSA